jgi:X-Pro dipeptidyl-peptidase
VEAPPHLAAIVPQVGITRWWDYAFGQGVRFYSGSGTPLAFDAGFNQARVPGADPGDVTELPDEANPCDSAEHQMRGYGPDPVHDAFWDERDYRARAAKVRVPVLIEGSWADYNVHPINGYEMWHALPASLPKWLRMGQQGHGASPFKDAQATRQAFYDRFLLGRDSGVERLPRVGSQANSGPVVASADFPPPGTSTRAVALKALEGDGDTWSDTDPLLGESDVLAGNAPSGVSLLFRDKPVAKVTRVAGVAELDATLSTDKESTYLTPVLFDEDATGARKVITRGLLNSRNRESIRTSLPLVTGKPWHGVVRFQPTDWYLAKGHRLGLAVMSMNTGEAMYGDSTFATNALDLARSSLRLPYAP